MLHVSRGSPVSCKRRKFFALRHFPPGCGPNAVKVRSNHEEKINSSLVTSENGKLADADKLLKDSVVVEASLVHSPVLKEELDILGSAGDLLLEISPLPNGASLSVSENNIETKPEKVPPSKLENGHCYSWMYAPPKRRNVSVIRQFPPGCGPNPENSIKELVVNKIEASSDASVRVADAEVSMEKMIKFDEEKIVHTNGHAIGSVLEIMTNITSPKFRSLDEDDKKPFLQQHETVKGSTMHASANHISPVVDNTPLAVEDSTRFIEADNQLKKLASTEKENSKYPKGKRLKENDMDGSVLVRTNSSKHVSVGEGQGQGGSEHVHIKSTLKPGVNRISIHSGSDKAFHSHKGSQFIRNLQTKASAKSPTASSVQETLVKDDEFNQRGGKKRKLPTEVFFHKGRKSDDGDDSLEAIGERMVIEALMAADNCPWRNSKRHGEISAGSLVPKGKTKKNFDHMPEIEKKDTTAIVCYKSSELSITMTPYAPAQLSHTGGDDEVVARHKVKRVLRLFQLLCRKLLQGEESGLKRMGKANRIDLQASMILKNNGECLSNGEPLIGHVPGVEVGDEFHYRVELSIVGLHRPFQAGIDFTKKNGMPVATSIVASGGYQDDVDASDILIYSGSGGNSAGGGDKAPADQKLERGNLALKNCIDTQTPVRVIHGFKEKGSDAQGKLVSTFTYDGLYHVETYWLERSAHGFNVFKFQLKRMAGQPELPFKELKRSTNSRDREGLCVRDMSRGKERIPISAVNTIDNEKPNPFKYITKSAYPSWYVKKPPRCCDCTDGCSDSEQCACAVKNGGEIPFNFNGAIVQAKPLIYECGPACKCPPSCHNRVSQHGIRVQLEVFKTSGRGWGVRSLRSIPSGSFVCEYVGELLQDGDAEQRTNNDEYLFDIGHNYDDRSLWEDLPNLIPELQSTNSACDTVEGVGFTIDAAELGNVGRFINHSCSPNLYAQNVLYDHDDRRVPHIMFFAVDNIPPLQELTYHYNYSLDQVRDSEGNIKQKACYCGSPECCGRLY